MKPPRLFEEQTFLRRHRLRIAEKVFERRQVASFWMTSFQGLVELLWITEQYQIFRRLRNGDHVSKRHLSCLIDEQHIDRLEIISLCPKPLRTCKDVRTSLKCRQRVLVLDRRSDVWRIVLRLIFLLYLLDAAQSSKAQFLGCLHDLLKQIRNNFVARCGNANFLTVTD